MRPKMIGSACFEAGMDDYLSKPIHPEKLKEVLLRCPRGSDPKPGAASPSPQSAFDSSAVEELRKSIDRDDLKNLMRLFAADIERNLRELEEGFSGQDFDKVRRACHSLKGVAGSAGAMTLSEAARAMEESLRKEQQDGAIEGLALVRRRAGEALAELPLLIDAV